MLAHAAYGRREVQDEILRLGGVHIMLSQCQVRQSQRHLINDFHSGRIFSWDTLGRPPTSRISANLWAARLMIRAPWSGSGLCGVCATCAWGMRQCSEPSWICSPWRRCKIRTWPRWACKCSWIRPAVNGLLPNKVMRDSVLAEWQCPMVRAKERILSVCFRK